MLELLCRHRLRRQSLGPFIRRWRRLRAQYGPPCCLCWKPLPRLVPYAEQGGKGYGPSRCIRVTWKRTCTSTPSYVPRYLCRDEVRCSTSCVGSCSTRLHLLSCTHKVTDRCGETRLLSPSCSLDQRKPAFWRYDLTHIPETHEHQSRSPPNAHSPGP